MKSQSSQPGDDAWLDALLDEALSPDQVPGGLPVGLTDRIFAATEHQLPGHSGHSGRRGVLAFIVGASAFSRIAATFLLVASLGVTFFVINKVNLDQERTEQARLAADLQQQEQARLARLAQLEEDLNRKFAYASTASDPLLLVNTPVDQTLDQVKARLNGGDITNAVENWDQMTESLEIELARLDTDTNG